MGVRHLPPLDRRADRDRADHAIRQPLAGPIAPGRRSRSCSASSARRRRRCWAIVARRAARVRRGDPRGPAARAVHAALLGLDRAPRRRARRLAVAPARDARARARSPTRRCSSPSSPWAAASAWPRCLAVGVADAGPTAMTRRAAYSVLQHDLRHPREQQRAGRRPAVRVDPVRRPRRAGDARRRLDLRARRHLAAVVAGLGYCMSARNRKPDRRVVVAGPIRDPRAPGEQREVARACVRLRPRASRGRRPSRPRRR